MVRSRHGNHGVSLTQIIMNFEKTGERRVLTVHAYRTAADTLVVHWRAPGRASFTVFGELRRSGTQLMQPASEDGPARHGALRHDHQGQAKPESESVAAIAVQRVHR